MIKSLELFFTETNINKMTERWKQQLVDYWHKKLAKEFEKKVKAWSIDEALSYAKEFDPDEWDWAQPDEVVGEDMSYWSY